MATLSPQTTGGGATLGSRNPFLGMITPQSTGPDSNGNTVSAPTNTSQAYESSASASAAEADKRSQTTPALIRSETSRSGALNSSSSTQTATPEPSSRAEETTARGRSYNPPLGPPPPPRLPPRTQNSPTMEAHTSERSSTLDVLEEDLPPAYTPGPNAREGEQSIEFGPLRPFQNVEPRLPPQQIPGNGIYFSSTQRGGGGRGRLEQRGGSLTRLLGDLIISSIISREELQRNQGPPYRSGQFSSPPAASNPSASYGSSVPSQPPPGRRNWSQYPGQMNRPTTPEPQAPPANDGKPTSRAIPGHPLLRHGQVLIYPPGFECNKCFNKGFRPVHASTFDPIPRALAPGDPSNPCRKCWRHYSHPYNTELAQLDWNDVVNANRQRPISDALQGPFRNGPPQVSSPAFSPRSNTPGPSMQPQFTGGHSQRSSPFGGPSSPRGRGSGSGFGRGGFPGILLVQADMPGGRTMYSPGDPRIGGRRCVKCGGTGQVRVFILESERCNMCGGIGRVF